MDHIRRPCSFVKIIDISHGPAPALSEVKEMIEERVRCKKSSTAYEKWIESKRRTAVIIKKI